MKQEFSKSSGPDLTEQLLRELGCEYEREDDGTIYVLGNIVLSGKNLTQLPDLSCVFVRGDFLCDHNRLTGLKGSPRVSGDFYCCDNQLTSLEGAPSSVGGSFYCSRNLLTNLRGAHQIICEDFWCNNNRLTSLVGAPTQMLQATSSFICTDNLLTTLKGAPQRVPALFDCKGNPLTSLEHAPQTFRKMMTDFGDFYSWAEVPENLRRRTEAFANGPNSPLVF
jgi:hypothetical protein